MTKFENIESTKDLIFFIVKSGGRYFFTNEEWGPFLEWYGNIQMHSIRINFFELGPLGKRKMTRFRHMTSLEWKGSKLEAVIELDTAGKPIVLVGFKGTLKV